MTDQKQFNELTARLTRLETLLQNNDAYSPPGAITLDDLDMGPGMNFDIPTYDQFVTENVQWDTAWDPNTYGTWQTQEIDDNNGFIDSQSNINAILARLNNIETFLGGGSNDTNQSDALDWGAETGDDGENGSGEASSSSSGIPAGYLPVELTVCVDGLSKTMNVIGTTPV